MIMTILITWTTIKWLTLASLVLSVFAFLYGDLPDSSGHAWANVLRWIVWPVFVLCVVAFIVRGFIA